MDPDQIYEHFDPRIGDRILKLCHWQQVEGPNLRFAEMDID